MTFDEFTSWLRKAPRGARKTYHSGHLVHDRGPDEKRFKTPRQVEVCLITDAAWSAARAGRLSLTQERVKPIGDLDATYNYVAERL